MHEQPPLRLIEWLVAAVVVLTGLSVGVDHWVKPQWDATQNAWVTPSRIAYWDDSMDRWQSETNAMYWNEERRVWMYENGVYWDKSTGRWLDEYGDYIDTTLNVWVNPERNAYWDSRRHEWRPLVIAP